jgi:hypothetical protein
MIRLSVGLNMSRIIWRTSARRSKPVRPEAIVRKRCNGQKLLDPDLVLLVFAGHRDLLLPGDVQDFCQPDP